MISFEDQYQKLQIENIRLRKKLKRKRKKSRKKKLLKKKLHQRSDERPRNTEASAVNPKDAAVTSELYNDGLIHLIRKEETKGD